MLPARFRSEEQQNRRGVLTIRGDRFDRNEKAERAHNDSLAEKYFDIWDSYPIQIFTNGLESEALAKVAQYGDRTLVIGVGGGRELPVLLDFGCQIVAIDVSPVMLKKGQERFPGAAIDWQIANANNLDQVGSRFDLVVALGGVVNFLLSFTDFCESLHSILQPGGRFIFDSFNSEFIGEKASFESNQGRIRTPHSFDSLSSELARAGFSGFHIEGFRFLADLLPPIFNTRADHPGRKVLEEVMDIETGLQEVLPATSAKFLLCYGQKP